MRCSEIEVGVINEVGVWLCCREKEGNLRRGGGRRVARNFVEEAVANVAAQHTRAAPVAPRHNLHLSHTTSVRARSEDEEGSTERIICIHKNNKKTSAGTRRTRRDLAL